MPSEVRGLALANKNTKLRLDPPGTARHDLAWDIPVKRKYLEEEESA